jgi:hypothetical protein
MRIKVKEETGCWLWTGTQQNGYGVVSIGNRAHRVHRLMHFLYFGDIARGFELHHRCGEKRCCNPWHLEEVTSEEHRERHPEYTGRHTHCIYGHAFTPENTYERKGGGRVCRTCNRIRVKEWYRGRRQRHRKRSGVQVEIKA